MKRIPCPGCEESTTPGEYNGSTCQKCGGTGALQRLVNTESHTPGPWKATNSACIWAVFATTRPLGDSRLCDFGSDDESKANAHLIAAAPDLLEAMERLLRCLSWIQHPTGLTLDAMEQAKATVAKAKGEGAHPAENVRDILADHERAQAAKEIIPFGYQRIDKRECIIRDEDLASPGHCPTCGNKLVNLLLIDPDGPATGQKEGECPACLKLWIESNRTRDPGL